MPANLTDAEEIRLLDLSLIDGDLLALTTTLPVDATAGTEVTGGPGPYARQSISFGNANSSGKANDAALAYTGLPAADIVAWEILDSTGAVRKWYGLFSAQAGTAQNTGDTVTVSAHGLLLNQKIVFQTGFVPAPLVAGTVYFARTITTNTFQVSATAGGAAIAITADNISPGIVVGKVHSVGVGDGLAVAIGAIVCTLN